MGLAVVVSGVFIYFVIRQKLTGRTPLFMHFTTLRRPERQQGIIIDADYNEIDKE